MLRVLPDAPDFPLGKEYPLVFLDRPVEILVLTGRLHVPVEEVDDGV